MTKLDPILAVKDVETSSAWYQSVFNFESMHGGAAFDILVGDDDEVLLCIHKWGAHEHPTMINDEEIAGNGLILYFRTENIEEVRENLRIMKYEVEEEISVSPNSRRKEFSVRDLDGYYLTIAEFHRYEG